MNNKLIALMKTELKSIINNMMPFGKRSAKNSFIMALCYIGPAALCLYISGVYTFIISMIDTGPELHLLYAIILPTMLVLMLSFYSAQGHLFAFRDYDLLTSMPISNAKIMMSKMLAFVAFNLYITFFLMLPPMVMYLIEVPPTILSMLYIVIGTLIVPLFPILLSSIAAFFISYLASKFRYSKIMTTVISILLFLGLFVGIGSLTAGLGSASESITLDAMTLVNDVKGIFPPAYYFVMGIARQSFFDMLLFCAMYIVPFGLFIVLFASTFKRINAKMSRTFTGKARKLKEKQITASSAFTALLKKEAKRYINSPMYVLNTGVMPLLAAIGSILLIILGPQEFEAILEIPGISAQLFIMCSIMLSVMGMMSSTSAVAISLEGKNFWLLKSLPVSIPHVFLAKISINLLVCVPLLSICAVALGIRFQFSILKILLLILFIFVGALYSGIVGIILNLKFPRLDWTNEVLIIKQSMSMILSMLAGGLTGIAAGFVLYNLQGTFDVHLILIGIIAVLSLLNTGLWYYLKGKGVKIFQSLG